MSDRRAVAPRTRWTEPTRALPLRWGGYTERLVIGTALILSGGICIAGADTFQLLALLATAPHMVGWAILPADGWRRLTAAVPSTLACWLLLTGPKFLLVLLLPYLCWMLVRHRPPLVAFVTAVIPAGAAVVIAASVRGYDAMLPALGVETAALVAGALSARVLASQVLPRRRREAPE
jgi:hypothetical protein